jgi:hypothetical protein
MEQDKTHLLRTPPICEKRIVKRTQKFVKRTLKIPPASNYVEKHDGFSVILGDKIVDGFNLTKSAKKCYQARKKDKVLSYSDLEVMNELSNLFESSVCEGREHTQLAGNIRLVKENKGKK